MGRYYIASLCKNGLLGGGISVDEDGITFRTGKLFVLPTVTVALRDGREYRFFVVGRNRLANMISEKIKK